MKNFNSPRRRTTLSGIVGCCLLTLTACSPETGTRVLAQVFLDDAPSSSATSEEEAPRPLPKFDRSIAVGSHWRLPSDKKAIIFFVPGIMAAASDAAELQLEELRLAKDGNETGFDMRRRDVRLRLLRGSLVLSVAADSDQAPLRIETVSGTLVAESGALVAVKSSSDGLHVACIRGKVQLISRDLGTATALRAGRWCDWKTGQAFPGEAQASAESAQSQEEVDSALDAEIGMKKLLVAEQESVPKWRHP